jgi:hypothetical protein
MSSQQRLADLRTVIASLADADAAFERLALIAKDLAVADARFDRRMAKAAAAHQDSTFDQRRDLAAIEADLALFVDAHRDCFAKPRTRKSELGEYGLRTVTDLVVDDAERLLSVLDDRGYTDCIETVRKVFKPAIKARLKEGERFPGCALRTGDTVVCKVNRALLDQAAEAVND